MTRYVALLRAVNVGGTGRLPMTELRALCAALGFAGARTLLASGNVVFDSPLREGEVKATLAEALAAHVGKPVGVLVRSGAELRAVLDANPHPDAPGDRAFAIFLDGPPPADAIERATGRTDEALALGAREIHAFYPDGVGRSKLRIPAAKDGTARNRNTIAKLVAMSADDRPG